MNNPARYHLRQHEDGQWHVIDDRTGGPAEIEYDGSFYVLWKLPKDEAEAWSRRLNGSGTAKGLN